MLTIIHWILVLCGLGYIAWWSWRLLQKMWWKLQCTYRNWWSNNDPSRVIRVKYKHWWWHLSPEKRFAARQIEQALQYRMEQPEVIQEFKDHIKRILIYGKPRTVDGAFRDRRPLTPEEQSKNNLVNRDEFINHKSGGLKDTFGTNGRTREWIMPVDALDEPDIPAGWAFISKVDGWDIRRPDQLARMDCLPETSADSLEEACQWVEGYLKLYPSEAEQVFKATADTCPKSRIIVSTPAGGKDNPYKDLLDDARHERAQLQADKLDNLYPQEEFPVYFAGIEDPKYLTPRTGSGHPGVVGFDNSPVPLTGCVDHHDESQVVRKSIEAQSDGNN